VDDSCVNHIIKPYISSSCLSFHTLKKFIYQKLLPKSHRTHIYGYFRLFVDYHLWVSIAATAQSQVLRAFFSYSTIVILL